MKIQNSFLIVLLIFLNLILFSKRSFSANELFRSVSSGNWNSNSTWELSSNGGGTWVPATFTPSETSGNINIRIPNTVTVTASVTANQLTVDSGAVLTISNGIVLTITAGTGNDLTVSPSSTLNGTGTVRTQGTIELNLRAGSFFNAALNVNTGTTTANDQTSPFEGSLFGTVTIDAGSTLTAGTSLRDLFLYGNVVNNGLLTAGSSTAVLKIRGLSLANNGSINTTGPLYFDNTTAVSGTGSFIISNTFISGNVVLQNNITYTPSLISVDSNGILNPNGKILTITQGTLEVKPTATVFDSGTIKTQGLVTLNLRAGSAFNADLNVNTGFTTANDQITPFEGSIFGNVTIDAGASLGVGSAGRILSIYGTVLNNGTLTGGSSSSTIKIRGSSFANNGTINTVGTVNFDSATSVSGSGTFSPNGTSIFGNVMLQNNITYQSTFINVETNGVLNMNGKVFTVAAGTLELFTGATVTASGTVRTQGNVNLNLGAGSAFNSALLIDTGLTIASNPITPFEAKVFGNVTVDPGAFLSVGGAGRDLFLYGSLVNNGSLTSSSNSTTIKIRGSSFTNNGTVISTGTFHFDTTTSFSGSGSISSTTIFSANANVTLNSNHTFSTIQINTGAVFNITNRLVKFTGSNPIQQNGTFNTTNSEIEYNGTAQQSVSAININYNGLNINNPVGAFLSGDITIPDTLKIILGDLTLNGKIITLTSTAYMTETPGNVVSGSGGYITTTRNVGAPASLNVGGMGAVLTSAVNLGITEVRRGHTIQTGLNGGTSIKRYYDIIPTNNSGLNATLIFKYDDSELNLKPEPSLKLFKSTNSGITWQLMGGVVNIASNQITVQNLTSFSRWSSDTAGVSAAITMLMQGFYDPAINALRMADTARAYLRNASAPYAVVDSSKGYLDSLTFRSSFQFTNAIAGSYYIVMKHRNSIETWSKNPVSYVPGTTLNYNFTTNVTQAFGNNMVIINTKSCFYSGDVNQDGNIDLTDITLVYNDANNFVTGYIRTDVNGDKVVDLTDLTLVYNNSVSFVGVVRP